MVRTRRTRPLLAGSCLLLLAGSGCGEDEAPPELPPRAILWQRIADTEAGHRSVIPGIVKAVENTKLAFEVGGIVETVEVEHGDRVEKEQVLARLDPEPFELAVGDAHANLADVHARLTSAVADFDRAQKLYKAKVESRQEYERAMARRDSFEGKVAAAEAHLEMARRELRRSVLTSPFEGSISVRNVDPAMKVASGQVVFEMDSGESGLRVEVQMPETLIARVRRGDEVAVGFPSSGVLQVAAEERTYPAVITQVGTRAETGNAFRVRADLRDSPDWLRPGMSAEVRFDTGREEGSAADAKGFLIPIAAALAEADDGFSVFVFDPESSTLSKRRVQAGGVRGNLFTILEGLEPGEIVATAGVSFLRDGQEVTLLDEHLVRNAP
jgi:RND family efflux transporter MFP subunit